MAKNDEKRAIRCSFCGKHQDQVTKIIAGPGAYICNECVQLCMDILDNMAAPEEQLVSPDMPEIIPYATFDRKYTGIAKFPAVTRDISMVMPKEILVGQVEEVIEKKGGAYLESYALFDIYEGEQIKKGFKSVAYSIVFRAKDKTLEEAEITSAMNKILEGLEALGIELRK